LYLSRFWIPGKVIILHDELVRLERDANRRERPVRRELPFQVTQGTQQTPGRYP